MKPKYDKNFKKMVVELYHSVTPIPELKNEYNLSEITIYKWIKQYSPITTIDDVETTPEDLKCMQK